MVLSSAPRFLLIAVSTYSLASGLAFADTPPLRHDPDEGMEASIRLGIPEPMVFDLVRPLGAAKGEFEVNSLFRHLPRGDGKMLWAPEIEYSFGRGFAVEFELPISGSSIEDYKIALQQKLPARRSKWYTHGLQGIGEVAKHESAWQASGLYIAGIRWRERWSTLSMIGFSHLRKENVGITAPLVNHSFFYERWRKTALGLEFNSKHPLRTKHEWLLMPQVHFRVVEKINLQFGAGYDRTAGNLSPVVGWRLIREL